jgi:glycosyltransferase involved in cell wall biosynthesis
MSDRLIVVVPCYNEAMRLDASAFRAFLEQEPTVEFLFVNDGSTDNTAQVLAALCAADAKRLSVFELEHNSGKAEAVRRGILEAIDRGADVVAFWDADLATPLDAIPQFAAVLQARPGLGIVIGSRVQLLGRRIERKLSRHYLGRAFATTVSLVLGLRVYDTQCGAKMFRATPEIRSVFAGAFHSKWIFDVEILARLMMSRRTLQLPRLEQYIYEIPLTEWHDVRGSKVRSRDFLVAIPELARIWWRYLRGGTRHHLSAAEPAEPARSPAARR